MHSERPFDLSQWEEVIEAEGLTPDHPQWLKHYYDVLFAYSDVDIYLYGLEPEQVAAKVNGQTETDNDISDKCHYTGIRNLSCSAESESSACMVWVFRLCGRLVCR